MGAVQARGLSGRSQHWLVWLGLEGKEWDEAPLSHKDVMAVRNGFILDITMHGEKPRDGVISRFLDMEPSKAITHGSEHAMTRFQIRIANRAVGCAQDMMLRKQFHTSLEEQTPRGSSYAQIDGSPLLVGSGPNGGFEGADFVAVDNVAMSLRPTPGCSSSGGAHPPNRRRAKALRACVLHGEDIQRDSSLSGARDQEVAAFLVDVLEMRVKAVVACGFVGAHNESCVKTLTDLDRPYIASGIFECCNDLPSSIRMDHPSYSRGAPRDFFNYFGSPDGDDGLDWRPCETRAPGLSTQRAQVGGLTLVSTLLAEDCTGAPEGSSYKVANYRLEVSWKEGLLFSSKTRQAELTVCHIQSADNGPVQLTRQQAAMLYAAAARADPEDPGDLGFRGEGRVLVHCHAGAGRAVNIAYGLAEVMCNGVPNDAMAKLQWLRQSCPATMQTPEQLIDGVQLSIHLLEELQGRVSLSCSSPEGGDGRGVHHVAAAAAGLSIGDGLAARSQSAADCGRVGRAISSLVRGRRQGHRSVDGY